MTDLASPQTTAHTTPTRVDMALTAPVDLAGIVDDLFGGSLAGIFDRIEWAEEEITQARARHPRHAERLFHSFLLLRPTHERMATEFVYRSHCRELLDRVAIGVDTRPGTAAEICCAMLQVSLVGPMRSAATGLYMRMWQAAGFPEIREFTKASQHYEALRKAVIDDHEQFVRRTFAVTDRYLGDIDCAGRHHGDELTCVYAPNHPAAAA